MTLSCSLYRKSMQTTTLQRIQDRLDGVRASARRITMLNALLNLNSAEML